MASVAIVTIVVVALLTAVIALLSWLAYSSCLRTYRIEVAEGMHDEAIESGYSAGKRRKRKGEVAGAIASYALLAALLSVFAAGIAYRAQGGSLSINGQTALVIKSGSMSGFYDEALAGEYESCGYDAGLQFAVGDICAFESLPADAGLTLGDVYGYRRKDNIITHRLVGLRDGGLCEFRGDNNPTWDGYLVKRESVVLHYTGSKAPGIGALVLYAQSYFGVWSLAGLVGVSVGSEVVNRKVEGINSKRSRELGGSGDGK